MSDKPKLCFILPEYSEKTHFRYVAIFAEALQDRADICLVQEKGGDMLRASFPRFYLQRLRWGPVRMVENFLVLLGAWLRGYRTFYVHYSFVSAVHAGIITRVFGGTVYYWNCGMPWQYPRSRVRAWYERLAYRLVHHLVTGAQALVPEYARYYGLDPASVVVIPNWVESPRQVDEQMAARVRKDIQASPGTRILLYVHRLARRKGAHHLPHIAELLRDEEVVLAVIGEGPEQDALVHECETRDLCGRLGFLGVRDRAYVDAAFRCADVFLMPSEEEGSPHALLEAMAAEVPFVTFDVGGVRETAPASCEAYVVPPNDVPTLVERVRTLLHDPAEYARVQREEREWVRRFALAPTIDHFSEEVLGMHPH